MDPSAFSARRATLDDLPLLQALWQEAGLPGEELEKFLAEFQVVADEDGSLLAAIGLLVEGSHGLLHTEAIAAAAADQADEMRAALWRRLQIVARNQGLHRIWTQEDGEFWRGVFTLADSGTVTEAGTTFLTADPTAAWFQHELLDPAKAKQLVNEQMAIWAATREQEREQFRNKTRVFMWIAMTVAFAVLAMCGYVLFRVFSSPQGTELLNRTIRGQ